MTNTTAHVYNALSVNGNGKCREEGRTAVRKIRRRDAAGITDR
ncbi:MAG: hypothetical protein RBT80_17130 [Candidatus Vecturithrix sp.]|nr:hypothetical protein [Candidatus Vecturithrix sp.]